MDFKATAPQPAARNVDMTLHERASELHRIMVGYDMDSAANWLKEGNKQAIEGIKTNIPLQQRIVREEDFVRGRFSTAFMERFLEPQDELQSD